MRLPIVAPLTLRSFHLAVRTFLYFSIGMRIGQSVIRCSLKCFRIPLRHVCYTLTHWNCLIFAEVEKTLQEGGTPPGSEPQPTGPMSTFSSRARGAGDRATAPATPPPVQMRRPINRRGKQAPTPPKRTRYCLTLLTSAVVFIVVSPCLMMRFDTSGSTVVWMFEALNFYAIY